MCPMWSPGHLPLQSLTSHKSQLLKPYCKKDSEFERMAEGVLFSIAQAILKNLGSRALDEMASAGGFKAELEKLKNTMNAIKNVLLDAEERQLESHAVQGWFSRLQAVVYTADDLFDELVTVASQIELLDGNDLTSKVHVSLSPSNPYTAAFTISQMIKRIREDLDEIVKEGNEFSFVQRPYDERGLVHRQQRDENYPFVASQEVVGRDDDKKAILDTLLDSTSQEHVAVVPIVGIGGLGKTTLAQLLYNDEKVEKHFELRLWVCVSDFDAFDIKDIIKKILMATAYAEPHRLEMDQLQSWLQRRVGGKKYLLVLDNVWNEDREQWLKLKALLKCGREGSKILVTTRSRCVADVMGTEPPHELKGLSGNHSWVLFEKMAFETGQAEKNSNLVKLGKEILQKCSDVPLAIRTLGSLLYGKDESKWLSFKDKSLAQLSEDGNNIMSILKLSYHQLWSPLKNCFSYCALFPKDYKLEKETLINLWMAEGFLIPTKENQSLEEVGEEYFLTLLHGCFFQNIMKDYWGNVESCKMHDLMHDLAQQVAGVEIAVATPGEGKLDERIRRLSLSYCLTSTQQMQSCVLNLKLLRTFLLPEQREDRSDFSTTICHQLASNSRCLRVLDLHGLGIESLPSSIGSLVHLRHLNLSYMSIQVLPDSITELQNLQTLDLSRCCSLRRLPTDIRKLTNLRTLDVYLCWGLTCMPSGIGALTLLHKLTRLIVNNRDPVALRCKHATAQLRDLKNLNNLSGELYIEILGKLTDPIFEAKEADLSSKNGLIFLQIRGDEELYEQVEGSNHDEAVLEGLKPHPNLKLLEIYWYRGQKFPSWDVMNNLSTSLPNLVDIKLQWCGNCQQLPAFSQLLFLECLCLVNLESLEYMENSLSWLSLSREEAFFPSLQELTLVEMDNLKGWWKEVGATARDDQKDLLVHLLGKSFSKLTKLAIMNCPNLTSIPLCPNVEELDLMDVNQQLSVLKMATATSSSSPLCGPFSKLKSLCIDGVKFLP